MSEWLYGQHAVAETLAAGRRRVHDVWVLDGARRTRIDSIRTLAAARGTPALDVGQERLLTVGLGHATAVAARCSPYPYVDEADLSKPDGDALLVLLDRIQDPQNLGAIARTAEAAGAVALCIPDRRAASVTPAVVHASAGATEHLRICRVRNVAAALEKLEKLGYWRFGLDGDGTERWDAVDYRGGAALVVGGEGGGLRRLVAAKCDHRVALPMAGKVASLNASAAFAAVAFEVVRQHGQTRRRHARDRS